MRPCPYQNYVFGVSQADLIKLINSDTSNLEGLDSIVYVVTWIPSECWIVFHLLVRPRDFLCPITSREALVPTQLSKQWVPNSWLGSKRPGCESNRLYLVTKLMSGFFSQFYRASWCYQSLLFTNWWTINRVILKEY